MFENIIGNKSLIETLARELETDTFPHAVLFTGPAYTGKLSTALETARVLTCRERGAWSCACRACYQQRLLLHPYTVQTGSRSFRVEIRASRDVLARTGTAAARFLFVRAVRKLVRRFEPHIFQVDEARRKEIENLLLRTEEAAAAFQPGPPLPEQKKAEKLFREIEETTERLEQFLPRDNIPVAVVRNISQWANMTAASAKKVIIIENAARMQDASRNALLKILEEPPADTHFILIAPRAAELIPTIRSRLRVYRFQGRSDDEARDVLSRIFREENPDYHTLKDYFLAWEDVHITAVRSLALRFLEKVLTPEPVIIQNELPELFQRDLPRGFFLTFLEELLGAFRALLFGEESAARLAAPPLERFEAWTVTVHRRLREFQTLNVAPALFLENLYLTLREAR